MDENNTLINALSNAALELLLRTAETDSDYTVAVEYLLSQISTLTKE